MNRRTIRVNVYTQHDAESHLIEIPAAALAGLALRAVFERDRVVRFGGADLHYRLLLKMGADWMWFVVAMGEA